MAEASKSKLWGAARVAAAAAAAKMYSILLLPLRLITICTTLYSSHGNRSLIKCLVVREPLTPTLASVLPLFVHPGPWPEPDQPLTYFSDLADDQCSAAATSAPPSSTLSPPPPSRNRQHQPASQPARVDKRARPHARTPTSRPWVAPARP